MGKKKGLFTILKRIFISEAHSDKVKNKENLILKPSCFILGYVFYAEREEKKMDILEA